MKPLSLMSLDELKEYREVLLKSPKTVGNIRRLVSVEKLINQKSCEANV